MEQFEDFLTEQNDEIYQAAFELIKALTRDPEMEWDMHYIGNVVGAAEETMKKMGLETCYPFYSESEKEGRVPCWLTDDCNNAGCPMRCRYQYEMDGKGVKELPHIVLVDAAEAMTMIADLGNGKPTDIGDRTSRYIEIAHGTGDKSDKTVKAALIEGKVWLDEDKWFYSLHILDDLNERDGVLISTSSLDPDELCGLMDDILGKLERGENL